MSFTGILQLLFDNGDCPATSTDMSAYLYKGNEGTSDGSLGSSGGVSGQPVRFDKSTNQRWSCSFTLVDTSGTGAHRPVVGQPFRLLEDGAVRFSGFIDQTDEAAFEGGSTILYACTCSSWASLFDRRVVTKVYQQNEAASSVIADIIANLGEGITTLNVVVAGVLTTPIALDGPTTVAQAFDTIRDMVDAQWWVDEAKDLHFVEVNAGPTLGWSLTTTEPVDWQAGSLKVTRTTKDYRNVQYVTSSALGQPPPTSVTSNPVSSNPTYTTLTDTFTTASALDFWVLTSQPIQLDPANPVPPTVKVNGVAQNMAEYPVITANAVFDVWYWGVNSVGVQHFYFGSQLAPSPGSVVEVTYQAFAGGGGTIAVSAGGGSNAPGIAPTKNWVVQENAAQIAARALIEGHSGRWEQVTSVPGVSDATVANSLAAGLLVRSAVIPDVITFDTWRSDYVIGGKLSVVIGYHGLNGTYTVQDISATEIPDVEGPISHQTFIYTITLSNAQNIGDYVKWFEGLIRSVGVSAGSGGSAAATGSAPPRAIQVIREVPSGLMDGSNKVFTLAFTPEPPWAVWLMLNGVLQHELGSIAEYSLSGNTITFTTAPHSDDEMTCIYFIANQGLAPLKVEQTVYSTGIYQADGQVDAHWTVDGAPAFVVDVAALPPAWVAAPTGTRWISVSHLGVGSGGLHTYKMLFQFPSTTGSLTGYVSGDDDYNIKLNGVSIGSGGFASWTALHPFGTATGFIAGVNTLTIEVNEDGSGGHGLLVQITGAFSS